VTIAARICDREVDGQIPMSHRAFLDVERMVDTEPLGALELKGVRNEVEVYSVRGFKTAVA
jgi:class 3 adenylate cyclase